MRHRYGPCPGQPRASGKLGALPEFGIKSGLTLGLTKDEEELVRKGAELYKTVYLDTIREPRHRARWFR